MIDSEQSLSSYVTSLSETQRRNRQEFIRLAYDDAIVWKILQRVGVAIGKGGEIKDKDVVYAEQILAGQKNDLYIQLRKIRTEDQARLPEVDEMTRKLDMVLRDYLIIHMRVTGELDENF
ncbi:MAG TPA: hypothetical protein DCS29_02065 [Candidatus Magasanikbacteria bacterium]|nr:MAG: hypothetical protein A2479_00385 [Candidatus Magasanikbacteria bacterium RIFOXYC2_FULL_39_8]HAT03541.1 hypothetical protein [Candidatus Magasanikbacteria bacterium]